MPIDPDWPMMGYTINVGQGILCKDEVVRPEDVPKGPRLDAVHGSGLQVQQDGPRHILLS